MKNIAQKEALFINISHAVIVLCPPEFKICHEKKKEKIYEKLKGFSRKGAAPLSNW